MLICLNIFESEIEFSTLKFETIIRWFLTWPCRHFILLLIRTTRWKKHFHLFYNVRNRVNFIESKACAPIHVHVSVDNIVLEQYVCNHGRQLCAATLPQVTRWQLPPINSSHLLRVLILPCSVPFRSVWPNRLSVSTHRYQSANGNTCTFAVLAEISLTQTRVFDSSE